MFYYDAQTNNAVGPFNPGYDSTIGGHKGFYYYGAPFSGGEVPQGMITPPTNRMNVGTGVSYTSLPTSGIGSIGGAIYNALGGALGFVDKVAEAFTADLRKDNIEKARSGGLQETDRILAELQNKLQSLEARLKSTKADEDAGVNKLLQQFFRFDLTRQNATWSPVVDAGDGLVTSKRDGPVEKFFDTLRMAAMSIYQGDNASAQDYLAEAKAIRSRTPDIDQYIAGYANQLQKFAEIIVSTGKLPLTLTRGACAEMRCGERRFAYGYDGPINAESPFMLKQLQSPSLSAEATLVDESIRDLMSLRLEQVAAIEEAARQAAAEEAARQAMMQQQAAAEEAARQAMLQEQAMAEEAARQAMLQQQAMAQPQAYPPQMPSMPATTEMEVAMMQQQQAEQEAQEQKSLMEREILAEQARLDQEEELRRQEMMEAERAFAQQQQAVQEFVDPYAQVPIQEQEQIIAETVVPPQESLQEGPVDIPPELPLPFEEPKQEQESKKKKIGVLPLALGASAIAAVGYFIFMRD